MPLTRGVNDNRARMIVESVGRGWVAEGRCVDHPATWMQRQISRWRVRQAQDDAEVRKAKDGGKPGGYSFSGNYTGKML